MAWNKKINPVYHPHYRLEEHRYGMWRNVHEVTRRAEYLRAATELMRNPIRFYAAMHRAVEEWPLSCEHNLTRPSVNRQAWMGHAGCCIEVGSPEDVTRQAWHTLTQTEQDAANDVADKVIAAWELKYLKGADSDAKELFQRRCLDRRPRAHRVDIRSIRACLREF